MAAPIWLVAGLSLAISGTRDHPLRERMDDVRARLVEHDVKGIFHLVAEPPFLVIGDEDARVVERRARTTIRWAVRRLREDLFERDPVGIVEIWLFKDDQSYQSNTLALFGEKPYSPYGFYAETHQALLMNIATGDGTLVHEIVHPFMAANFPECPTWLNEGLGSLFEQSSERNGQIVGLTNWRLDGLQDAIRARAVPSFETLLTTTERSFYEQDHGTNYAQARYLMYYLQEHGLLRDLYVRVKDERGHDPSGLGTLKAVLRTEDLSAFQQRWEKWVLQLKFPEVEHRRAARELLRKKRENSPWESSR